MAIRVQVLAKAPIPGQVKTRLIPRLGENCAANLQAILIARAIDTALSAKVGKVELWCAPNTAHDVFAPLAGRGVMLHDQGSGDIGERMHRALRYAQSWGDGAILIGTDCPALSAGDLRAAAASLAAGMDAAIVPAEDGGYVLLATSNPRTELFEGISWGSNTVMAETRSRMSRLAWRWQELPVRWDVDRPEDYDRLLREQLLENHDV